MRTCPQPSYWYYHACNLLCSHYTSLSPITSLWLIPSNINLQMYALYQDPEGKRVFDKSSPSDRQSHRDSMEQSHGNRYRTSTGLEEKVCNVNISWMIRVMSWGGVWCLAGFITAAFSFMLSLNSPVYQVVWCFGLSISWMIKVRYHVEPFCTSFFCGVTHNIIIACSSPAFSFILLLISSSLLLPAFAASCTMFLALSSLHLTMHRDYYYTSLKH